MSRFCTLLLLLSLAANAHAQSKPVRSSNANKAAKAAGAAIPVHDPPDQPFRRAAMPESSRTIVVSPGTNLHVAFDAQLLRTHTAWTGPGLNLFGPQFTDHKAPFLSHAIGQRLWGNPPFFPWSDNGRFDLSATNRPAGAAFKGISTKGGRTTFIYDVPAGASKVVRVHESPVLERSGEQDVVARRFEIAPAETDLRLLAHAETGRRIIRINQPAVMIERDKDFLVAVLRGTSGARWEVEEADATYTVPLTVESGTRNDITNVVVSGHQARAFVRIASHDAPVAVEIVTAVGKSSADCERLAAVLSRTEVAPADMEYISNARPDTKPRPVKAAAAEKDFPKGPTGDEFYRIEHYPVPKEIDLLVGGMDQLPDDNLVVATWPGDIYIVEGAEGPVEQAMYRRFARGLDSPMGLRIVNGQIYVVQKPELTRLVDTDANGEADLYETITDGWGYNGSYGHFIFGPVIDAAGNFYIFPNGNHGHWRDLYSGWAVRISPDGRKQEGVASGLRVPNGFAAFGLERDIFVTDNQGNWIGACKLNHIQPGKFYGFPSGMPGPEKKFHKPESFDPPALWFPRKFAPSASDIAVIEDDRFGPFQGQMIVGDFQNSLLMRVALEKVDGEWQGAVWPFAKGFLSAVNRLVYGRDGRLYVGGCKRAWPAVVPMEYSLERVSWTGKVPFEIREVRALPDGFELAFTQPIDPETATDPEGYFVEQFGYKYHGTYGSPEIDFEGNEDSATEIEVIGTEVSSDRHRVRLKLKGWREGYVCHVRVLDVMNARGDLLRHDTFYYTLNRIPK